MSLLRRNLVFVLAWILFWALMMFVAVEDYRHGVHDGAIWKPMLWEGSSALVTTIVALVHVRRSRRDAHLLGTPWRWFARQALWLPAYWIAILWGAFDIREAVYALAGETYHHDPLPQLFVYEAIKISIFAGLFAAVLFGIRSYRALLEQKLHAEQAHARLAEAQLLRLGQQMQPHFLFNALNTVSSLMYTDVARADATLAQLADMLRSTLALGERHTAPLSTELRLAQAYAGVMAERFADRVGIAWRVDDSLLGHEVPVLSLQPLLENVFKHTVERRRGLTRIAVSARREGQALVLGVEDDAGELRGELRGEPGEAAARPGGGIGLANLRARLAALYGDGARLDLVGLPGGGVRAELTLPCVSLPCAS